MAEPSQSITSPFQGRIKVYDTPDGSDVPWTQPRRVHLHRKTQSGATLCCASITIGGIIKDPNQWLLWLTSDKLVPESESEIEQHVDTNDESCEFVGRVKYTNRNLHYALININIIAPGPIQDGMDCISTSLAYEATLHPVLVKDEHRKSDLVVMTRSRNKEVMTGRITSLPSRVARPAYMGTGELMVAHFDPAHGRVPSKMDAGTWVYVRRPGFDQDPLYSGVRGVEKLEEGVNYVGVFGEDDSEDNSKKTFIPVVLLGHIVEVFDDGDRDASVKVTIQGSYEVLTEIFISRRNVYYPDGVDRGLLGIDE